MKAIPVTDKNFLGAKKHKGQYYVPAFGPFIFDLNQRGYTIPYPEQEFVELPEADIYELYPYQKRILSWLMASDLPGHILAMAQRLGKTRTALAYAKISKAEKVLFVTLKEVIPTAQHEAKEWFGLDFVRIGAQDNDYPDSNLIITNSQFIVAERKRANKEKRASFFDQYFDLIIFDESHGLKNRQSKINREMVKMARNSGERLLLSATPTTKYLDDLYGQLAVCAPRLFTSYWDFVRTFCLVEQKFFSGRTVTIVADNKDFDHRQVFADFVYPLSFEEGSGYLPDLQHQHFYAELEGQQEELCRQAVEQFFIELDDDHEEEELLISGVLPKLIRLRQVLNAPTMFQKNSNNAKLDLLNVLLETNDITLPAVIWHWHVDVGHAIYEGLDKDQFRVFQVSTEADNAQEGMKKMQAGDLDILIAPIAKMAMGVRLDKANSLVFFENDFRWDMYSQALQRATAVEKRTPIQIAHLRVQNTVDDLIYGALERKTNAGQKLYRHELEQFLGKA